jgi:hypothetical protein
MPQGGNTGPIAASKAAQDESYETARMASNGHGGSSREAMREPGLRLDVGQQALMSWLVSLLGGERKKQYSNQSRSKERVADSACAGPLLGY